MAKIKKPKAPKFSPNPEFLKPQKSGKSGAPLIVLIASIALTLGMGGLHYFAKQKPLPPLVAVYPVPPAHLNPVPSPGSGAEQTQRRAESLNRSGRRLTSPILTSEAVRQWAGRQAIAAFTFNFFEFNSEIRRLRPYFTVDGYEAFLTALERSEAELVVTSRQLVVSAVATGDPIVVNRKINLDGTRQWNVQTPIEVTFTAGSTDQTSVRPMIVQMTVISRPSSEIVTGLAIKNFIAVSGSPDQR